MELLLTTHPGLEPVVHEEIEARARAAGLPEGAVKRRPSPVRGRVRAAIDGPGALGVATALRSVHRVLLPVLEARVDPVTLDAIGAAVADADIPELATASSFRVRTHRIGRHDFSSVDVERRAGAVLVRRYGTRVRLDDPEVEVRVDVVDDAVLVARPHTRLALSRRARPFHQRVGLKANVAWAAVWLTGLDRPRRIADPFCGAGTLLLEAGTEHPEAELWGSDWVARAARGAKANLDAWGFGARAHVFHADVRDLAGRLPKHGVDAVITNPPFGVRIGNAIKFFGFYTGVLHLMQDILTPTGRLTLLTDRKQAFDGALKHAGGYRKVRELMVETGDVRPWIVVLERDDAA